MGCTWGGRSLRVGGLTTNHGRPPPLAAFVLLLYVFSPIHRHPSLHWPSLNPGPSHLVTRYQDALIKGKGAMVRCDGCGHKAIDEVLAQAAAGKSLREP